MNKVYIAKTDALEDERIFRRLYNAVSEERRQKTDRFIFKKDKMLSLSAGVLLKKALSDVAGEKYDIEYGKYGKPYIKNSDIFFNLSHSENTVMCAVSSVEIGCDTEKITDIDMEIARKFFCDKEYCTIENEMSYTKKCDMFFRLWTLKESFLKSVGIGMSVPMDSFCIDIKNDGISIFQNLNEEKYYFKEYNFNDGYKYSVCCLSPNFENNAEFVSL